MTGARLAVGKYAPKGVNRQHALGGRRQPQGSKLQLLLTQLQRPGRAAGAVPRLRGELTGGWGREQEGTETAECDYPWS